MDPFLNLPDSDGDTDGSRGHTAVELSRERLGLLTQTDTTC
ncbi:hypothetical protein [Sphaerisporangium album]|nr:hypothetical protein [Sphaerisporangium album]